MDINTQVSNISIVKEEVDAIDPLNNVKTELELFNIKDEPFEVLSAAGTQFNTTENVPIEVLHICVDPLMDYDGLEVKCEDADDSEQPCKSELLEIGSEWTDEDAGTSYSPMNSTELANVHVEKPNKVLNDYIEIKNQLSTSTYICKICSKSYSQKSRLSQHLKIHCGIKSDLDIDYEKPFKCTICSKSFIKNFHLIDHSRTHTGEKPFKCDICSKSFTVKSHLTRHLRIHSGENPFKCKICSTEFNQKSNLSRHLECHMGAKHFTCKICSKQFNQKANLTVHERFHEGVKPFTCEICSKQYTVKSQLIKHLRVHSGEKPFACKVCAKQFNQKSNLSRHLKFHKGKAYLGQCLGAEKS